MFYFPIPSVLKFSSLASPKFHNEIVLGPGNSLRQRVELPKSLYITSIASYNVPQKSAVGGKILH